MSHSQAAIDHNVIGEPGKIKIETGLCNEPPHKSSLSILVSAVVALSLIATI